MSTQISLVVLILKQQKSLKTKPQRPFYISSTSLYSSVHLNIAQIGDDVFCTYHEILSRLSVRHNCPVDDQDYTTILSFLQTVVIQDGVSVFFYCIVIYLSDTWCGSNTVKLCQKFQFSQIDASKMTAD